MTRGDNSPKEIMFSVSNRENEVSQKESQVVQTEVTS